MEHKISLEHIKKIHFMGIGGSGMSPIAEILHHKGFQVTGSDINESDTLQRVRSWGVRVLTGQKAENITDIQPELVVYSAAVKPENPELMAAQEKGIPTVERSVMLGIVTEHYPNSTAIAGTHGKTTTTAMLTQIMMTGKKDPSAIIGGQLPLIGSNAQIGQSDIMICEACEFVDTFLQLYPKVSVILNVDADHLEYFHTLERIIESFHQFASQTQETIFINGDDPNVRKAVEGITDKKIITFGMKESNDYSAVGIVDEPKALEQFTLTYQGKPLADIQLSVPGKHNIMNALAAAATAHYYGVDPQAIAKGLHEFTGVHRRFELLGTFHGVTVADDFAHHPTELTATLDAAMQMGFREVWAVFQPHTFSRTYLLLDDFAKALQIPDHVVMTEILAVREVNTYGIQVQDLANKVPGSCWFPSFDKISDYVIEHAQSGDLILTLGGGDIYKCANQIVEKYKAKQ